MNKVFKDLMSSAPAGKSKPPAKDKGKSVPRTPAPQKAEPLVVVSPSPAGQPGPSEKRKSRRSSDRSSSKRLPKRLKEGATDQEKATACKFLNKKIIVADRVVIGLNDYEKNQFVSTTRKELRDALLEVNARALLLSRELGEELMKDNSTAMESLKSQLAEASSSLKGAQADNERAKGEILSLRKLVKDLRGENRSLKEQCWSAEEKERATAGRVEHLSLDIADLTDKVTKLTLDLEEERLQRKKAEDDLVEFKGFVLEQHDLGFMRAVRQATFFYQVPIDEGKFDNPKDIYRGELVSAMDVPDKEDEDDEDSGCPAAEGDQPDPEVILSD